MRRRRCLVPADGFYEWKDEGGRRRPYCVRPKDGEPIAFAGLWETWVGPNGEELETATIITTNASRDLAALHERMPVIVPPAAFDFWLDCRNVDAPTATALLSPAGEGLLDAYEVSPAVNRAANDEPALIEPISPQQAAPPAVQEDASAPAKREKKPKKDERQSLFEWAANVRQSSLK
jgi:putative SOS response-associated peptidase YedK